MSVVNFLLSSFTLDYCDEEGWTCPDSYTCMVPRGGTQHACVDATDQILDAIEDNTRNNNVLLHINADSLIVVS